MQQFTLKTLWSALLLTLALMVSGGVWGQSAVVTLRPTHIDLSSTTSEGAVLMTLSSYSLNDARYRLYNGSYQYNPWDEATDAYISSASYASGPQVPGTPTTSTTFWILFQRGNNNATAASYRDRLGPSYESNHRTVALPAATSISTPFNLTGTFTGAGGYDNTLKHVVLGFNGTTLVTATSTTLTTGAFTLVCPTGTTIDKIEVRAIDNTSIADITGSWTATTAVGDIPSGGSPTPLITVTPSTLTGFTYVQGNGPSVEQSFTVSGSDLDGNITLTPPTNYEISETSGSGFTSSTVTLTQAGGSVAETTINVRLKAGLSAGDYNGETITASSTGAVNKTVTCDGSVSAPPDPEPTNHPQNLIAAAGTPSHSSIDLVWDDAVGGTVPTGYLLKANTSGTFDDPIDGTDPAVDTDLSDGEALVKVLAGVESHTFTGLSASTLYYFKLWPYTNSGANIDFKTDGTVPTANATTNAAPPVPKIFISEYLEGASNNKAIEIYNGEDVAIDLTLLTVNLYSNGSATVSSTWTGASGTLAVGSSYILFNSSSITAIQDIGNESSGISNFNGDDALEIVYNGITTDVFGQIGTDPGTGWAVAGTANATVDQTLIRKLSVSQGNVNNLGSFGSTAEDSEWIIQPIDYLGNLGAFASGWKGTTSTVWSVETNWDAGVPSATNNIIINDVDNNPLISDYREVNNATIRTNGLLTIESNGSLDISGTLTNNAGASGLVIESTGAGTGSLITSGTVTGDITVQRYIPGASEDWHLVSSPVSGQGISGDWIPAGTYPDGSGYDFYAWHEDGQIWVNRKNTTASPNGGAPRFDDASVNGNLNFNAARGYMTAYQASNPTKAFAGAPFNANQTYTLSRSGVGSNAGLNLVGNPFPATIAGNVNADGTNNFLTANAAVLDDSFEAYYYWDTPSNDYVAVNQSSGAHFIEVGQGFFVVASADDAVLNINTNLRKHGAATFYKYTDERKSLQLLVNSENGKINQTELVFDPAMSIGLDPGYDAAKLQGNTALSLYSLLPVPHERVFDIQSLPVPTEEMIVPIGITVDQPGVYHLTLNPTEAFEGSILASLYDKQTNTQLQIEGSTSYSFNIGEPGVYNQRFEIHFGALSINDNPGQLAATAYVHGGQLYILNGKGMTDIRVLDVQGRLLQSFQQHVEGVYSTGFNLPAGMYIIQLQDAQGVRNNKVIKQ